AMQSGVIDAAENNETALTTNNHGEVAKNYYYTEHATVPDILIMNKETYDSLTKQQQKWLEEAADYSTKKHEVIWYKEVKNAKKTAKEIMEVLFHNVDITSFKETPKPLPDEFKNNPDTK